MIPAKIPAKIPVGVLGATGAVGKRYCARLENHPWFKLVFKGASSARDSFESVDNIDLAKQRCNLVFSCVGSDALAIEQKYAEAGFTVISNTSAHRDHPLVPLIIPEINADHLAITSKQPWPGKIITKPNCTLQSYLLPLYPLHKAFGLKKIIVTTMQATSGGGDSFTLEGNILPYIAGEEEKSETEPLKILGNLTDAGITPNDQIAIAAHCNRVPVLDGHLACCSVEFETKPSEQEIRQAWADFPGLDLPTAPKQPIIYTEDEDRPQPLLDADAGDGMSVTVGRLRPCPVLDYRFTALSHNTIRGAAGGGILIAELLYAQT